MKRAPRIALAIAAALSVGLAIADVAVPDHAAPAQGTGGPMGGGMMMPGNGGPMGGGMMMPGNGGPMGPGMMMHGNAGPGRGMMMRGMHSGADAEHRGPMHEPMGGRGADASFGADMQLVHAMLLDHDKIRRTVTNLPDGIRTITESEDPAVAQAIKAHVASMERRLGEGKEFNLFSPTIPVLFDNRDKIKTVVEPTENGSIVTQTSSDSKVVAALQTHATEVSELARDGMVAMMRAARANMMSRATR
jgi:hypothetical protein